MRGDKGASIATRSISFNHWVHNTLAPAQLEMLGLACVELRGLARCYSITTPNKDGQTKDDNNTPLSIPPHNAHRRNSTGGVEFHWSSSPLYHPTVALAPACRGTPEQVERSSSVD